MVFTSAFGMGIDQPDVDKIIRVGVLPSMEQLVQELGRGGRDGRQCRELCFTMRAICNMPHTGAKERALKGNSTFYLIFRHHGSML